MNDNMSMFDQDRFKARVTHHSLEPLVSCAPHSYANRSPNLTTGPPRPPPLAAACRFHRDRSVWIFCGQPLCRVGVQAEHDQNGAPTGGNAFPDRSLVVARAWALAQP